MRKTHHNIVYENSDNQDYGIKNQVLSMTFSPYYTNEILLHDDTPSGFLSEGRNSSKLNESIINSMPHCRDNKLLNLVA